MSSTERSLRIDVADEPDRLLEHRLAQLVGELREALAIDRVVLFEAAEVEPVAAELGRQPRARSSFSIRRTCAMQHVLRCADRRRPRAPSSSSSGMLDQRK